MEIGIAGADFVRLEQQYCCGFEQRLEQRLEQHPELLNRRVEALIYGLSISRGLWLLEYPSVEMPAKLLHAGTLRAVKIVMRRSIHKQHRQAFRDELVPPRRDTGGVAKDAGTYPRGRLAFHVMQIFGGSSFHTLKHWTFQSRFACM